MKENIGNATYLRKDSGDYIPFRLRIRGTNSEEFNKMLDKNRVASF